MDCLCSRLTVTAIEAASLSTLLIGPESDILDDYVY